MNLPFRIDKIAQRFTITLKVLWHF